MSDFHDYSNSFIATLNYKIAKARSLRSQLGTGANKCDTCFRMREYMNQANPNYQPFTNYNDWEQAFNWQFVLALLLRSGNEVRCLLQYQNFPPLSSLTILLFYSTLLTDCDASYSSIQKEFRSGRKIQRPWPMDDGDGRRES